MDTDEHIPATPSGDPAPAGASCQVRVDLGALSHPGKVRPNNEDHYLVVELDRAMRVLLSNLPADLVPERVGECGYAMLVADGMGGQAAGEVASSMAIRVLVDLVLATPDWIMRLDEGGIQEIMRRTARRFEQVNEILAEQARMDWTLSGMGTTMTLAASLRADLIVAHVGDSRVYLYRQGQLVRLTRDHTLAEALAERGVISHEEAAKHRLRHVLTQALGPKAEKVQVDLDRLRLADGDQVLLCTDGLTDMVPDAAIAEALRQPGPAAEICQTLVDKALEGGGHDNVTVVLGRYHIPE
jgi:protein phosphatase